MFGFLKHFGETFAHGIENFGRDIEHVGKGVVDDVEKGAEVVASGVVSIVHKAENFVKKEACIAASIAHLLKRIDEHTVGLDTPSVNSAYTTWMTDTWDVIKVLKIRELAMLGTHDSGTYKIVGSSKDTPDADSTLTKWEDRLRDLESLKGVPRLAGLFGTDALNNVVANWGKAQGLTASEQLDRGARYLDLRLWWNGSEFLICHSKASAKVDDIIDEAATFAKAHPKEIVILDFNHFYNVEKPQLEMLVKKLQTAVGSITAPRTSLNPESPVSEFDGKNVIVIIEKDLTGVQPAGYVDELWKEGDITSPYSDSKDQYDKVTDLKKLVDERTKQIKIDHPGKLYVTQCNMTPSTDMYEKESTLYSQCGEPDCLMRLGRMINPAWVPFVGYYGIRGHSNIFIVDDFQGNEGFLPNVVAANIAKAGKKLAPNFYYDHLAWGDMTAVEQGHWGTLGYTNAIWTNGPPPPSGDWDWPELGNHSGFQQAATALGYTAASWGQPSPGNAYELPGGPEKNIGYYYDEQISWDNFGPIIQHYWEVLGWTETLWKTANAKSKTSGEHWSKLTPVGDDTGTNTGYPCGPFPPGSEKDAAAQLGYHKETWKTTD